MSPILEEQTNSKISSEQQHPRNYQNIHPLLGWYKSDLETSHLSYEKFLELTDPDNERAMYDLLTEIGLNAKLPKRKVCLNQAWYLKHWANKDLRGEGWPNYSRKEQ